MSERNNNKIFAGNMPNNQMPAGVPQQNVMRDEFGLDIPSESIPLPSNGVIYPTASSLHGKSSIEIRAMTAREEDILTSRALIKKGTVITHLIESCLTDKSVKAQSLLVGDRNAIMVALRVTGYGTEYQSEVECPSCGSKSKYEFDLSELPIQRLELQPIMVGENAFSFTLPYTKKEVVFRFLTGADEEEIAKLQEKYRKMGRMTDNLVTMKLERSILKIGNVDDRNKISHFIRNMPARDSRALRKYIDTNEPGILMKSWFDCSNCGEGTEINMPLGPSFFWPDA